MKIAASAKKHLSVYRGLPGDVYFLFLANVVNKVGSFVMPLLTLILTTKIGFSKADAGLFTTAAILTQAPFLLLGGKLADKLGNKRIIVAFEIAGAFAYLLCGFLKPSLLMALLMVLASDMFSMANPAINAIVAEVTTAETVKSAYSLMYLGTNLGWTVGPVVGGLLLSAQLNLMFVLDALTTFLSVGLIVLKVRAGTGNALYTATDSRNETQATESIFRFLRRNMFLVAFSAVLLIYNFCYIQWSYLLPLQMVDLWGADGSRLFSLLVSLNAVTVIVLTPVLTSATHRLHGITAIILGGALYAASYALFALSGVMAVFMGAIVMMTVGEILITINVNSYVALRTPQSHLSRVNSLLSVLNGVGYAVGPAAVGRLLLHLSIPNAWLLICALMTCGAGVMLLFRRFGDRT